MALHKVNPMKESCLLLVLWAVKEKATHFHNVTISMAQPKTCIMCNSQHIHHINIECAWWQTSENKLMEMLAR